MRRALAVLCTIATAAVLPVLTSPAQATPARPTPAHPARAAVDSPRDHDRSHPLDTQRTALRQEAVDQLVAGEAELHGRGADRTIAMADGTEVDYPATETAELLTFLVEFGDDPTDVPAGFPTAGPRHNQIPAPPASDNATYWRSDFNRAHYQDMFFEGLPDQGGESMRDLYDEMSSGRFDLQGDVSDWVRVEHPEAYYNDQDGLEGQAQMTAYIQDTAEAWYGAQVAGGADDEQLAAYLAQHDRWDRYDADGDGDFNESDGYIDHFQAIHAGEGEEAQAVGEDLWMIWSHRWAANIGGYGTEGPDPSQCEACGPQGGVEIGDTGYWILDYTTEPENGGLGVFAHEFGHDLGLPDYYETEADTDNGTGFWNLMSSGSWLGHGAGDVGTTPDQMGATEKLFLGWYGDGDLATLRAEDFDGAAEEVTLGPSYHATSVGAQAVLVALPDGERTLTGAMSGADGGGYLQSPPRNDTLSTAVSPVLGVPHGDSTVVARVAYQLEDGFDYAYLQVRPGGSPENDWTAVPTSRSAPDNPYGANAGHGITGTSSGWVELTADLAAYAGQGVQLRWVTLTDGRTHGWGFAVDSLELGGYATSFGPATDWELSYFYDVVGGEYDVTFPQYYVAENRQYRGYDRTLETGPYSANDPADNNRVDHFAYQDGLLVWYHNGWYSDNNTGAHPGGGMNLPVDASPVNQVWRDRAGQPAGLADNRLQTFDSTFDVDRTDGLSMSSGGALDLTVPAGPSVPVFDDADADGYLDDSGGPEGLAYSTEVAGAGVMMQVLSSDEQSGEMVVKIGERFVAATGAAAVTGTPAVGSTLRARPPAWFQNSVRTSVRWLRDGVVIPDALAATYEVTPADVDAEISAEVTGSKRDHRSTTVRTPGVTGLRAAPQATAEASITGTPQVGATLTANGATWPVAGDPPAFTWRVAGAQVGTGSTYVVRPQDLGKVVELDEVFSSEGHADATSSAVTGPVTVGPAATVTTPLGITGAARVGGTLTAQGAGWSRAGASTFSWSVGGTPAAAGTTYDVKPGDLGKAITLSETRTTPGYAAATTTASTTAVAAGAAPTATAAPRITGPARVGSTLAVAGATWPRTGSSTFAWSVGGRSVGTGTTYVVKAADVGAKVTVAETFVSAGYASGTASATSGTVAKAPVTLTVKAGPAKRHKKVPVTVRAASPDLTATGKVRVRYDGERVGTFTLRSGEVGLKLPRRPRGTYELEVTYLPARGFGSAGETVRIKVR